MLKVLSGTVEWPAAVPDIYAWGRCHITAGMASLVVEVGGTRCLAQDAMPMAEGTSVESDLC